jgi:hypothetical protein
MTPNVRKTASTRYAVEDAIRASKQRGPWKPNPNVMAWAEIVRTKDRGQA